MKTPLDHISFLNRKTDKEVEIFMSFGLLNEVLKLLGNNPTEIAGLDLNPQLAEPLLAALIAERDAKGAVVEIPAFDLTYEDAEAVFDWVKEHLLGYFMRRLSKTKTLFESHGDQLKHLGLLPTGTPSAA